GWRWGSRCGWRRSRRWGWVRWWRCGGRRWRRRSWIWWWRGRHVLHRDLPGSRARHRPGGVQALRTYAVGPIGNRRGVPDERARGKRGRRAARVDDAIDHHAEPAEISRIVRTGGDIDGPGRRRWNVDEDGCPGRGGQSEHQRSKENERRNGLV